MDDFTRVGKLIKFSPISYNNDEVLLAINVLRQICDFHNGCQDNIGFYYFHSELDKFIAFAEARGLK